MATNSTQGGITFTLNGTGLTVGNDAAGTAWAVLSAPDSITAITPAQTTDGAGDTINGAMLNPVRTTSTNPNQGYDERNGNWDVAENASPPFAVSAGDIIVKTVAATPYTAREGNFSEIAALHLLTAAPTGDYVLGSSIGWAGKSTPQWYSIDVDNWYNNRTVYASSGNDFPPFATLIDAVGQHHPLYGQIYASFASGQDQIYEQFAPRDFTGASTNNYGERMAETIAMALVALSSDAYTESQTKELCRKMIRLGVEWGDPMVYLGNSFIPDGGIRQFHQAVVAFAFYMTGRSDEIGDIMTNCPGNWDQAFKVTSALISSDFSPHSDTGKSAMWRRRTLGTQPGGTTLRIPCSGSASTGDWSQIEIPDGAIATRESDGQTAVVSVGERLALSGTIDVTLNVTSPFSSGDVIHFDAPSGWVEDGLYDWSMLGGYNGYAGQPRMYTPTGANRYRNNQAWFGAVMGLRALGCFDETAFEAVQGYCERAQESNNPSSDADYPPILADWGGYSAVSNTYLDHWTAIAAQTQLGDSPEVPSLQPQKTFSRTTAIE